MDSSINSITSVGIPGQLKINEKPTDKQSRDRKKKKRKDGESESPVKHKIDLKV